MDTYDTLMVGITQPVLDTWCRECEKFGHTAKHARWLVVEAYIHRNDAVST